MQRSTQGVECSVRHKAPNAAFDTRRRKQHSRQGVECTFVISVRLYMSKKTCARGLNEVLLDREFKEELGRSIIKTKTGSRRSRVPKSGFAIRALVDL